MLWRVDVEDDAGAVRGSARICADTLLREGFVRPSPTRNDDDCRMVGRPVTRPDGGDLRCLLGGEPFGVHVQVTGDLDRDFRVRMSAQSLSGRGAFEQRLSYRRLGPCPAGWRIGYAAPDGAVATADAVVRSAR